MKRILGMLLGGTALLLFVVAPAQAAMRVIVARMLGRRVQVVGVHAAKKAPISWQETEVATSTAGGTFFFHNGAVPPSCVGKLSDGVETAYIPVQGCVATGVNVAVTGQTTSYAGGDDGAVQAGFPFPSPRFTLNVNPADDTGVGGGVAGNGICDGTETCNGTFTDHLTGLIWLQNGWCADLNITGKTLVDLPTALEKVATLKGDGSMCAFTPSLFSHGPALPPLTDGSKAGDWRVPNVRELVSLIDFSGGTPPISPLMTSYISSTSSADNAQNMWLVNLEGHFWSAADTSKFYMGYVLPVRGGR